MKKIFILAVATLLVFSFIGVSTVTAEQCEKSPGFWKNHPEAWGIENIVVGGKTYTPAQAIKIMQTPVRGDKSYTLFKAAVATTLNISTGQCSPPPPPPECTPLTACWPNGTCDPLAQANLWLAAYGVGTGVRASTDMWQYSHGESIYLCLDAYNNGFFSN